MRIQYIYFVKQKQHHNDDWIVCWSLMCRLTDAFNTARDRVRYLESLSPHLEALEASPSLPSILSSLLPALVAGVKKMEGISRALARSGYLGILFTKVKTDTVEPLSEDTPEMRTPL